MFKSTLSKVLFGLGTLVVVGGIIGGAVWWQLGQPSEQNQPSPTPTLTVSVSPTVTTTPIPATKTTVLPHRFAGTLYDITITHPQDLIAKVTFNKASTKRNEFGSALITIPTSKGNAELLIKSRGYVPRIGADSNPKVSVTDSITRVPWSIPHDPQADTMNRFMYVSKDPTESDFAFTFAFLVNTKVGMVSGDLLIPKTAQENEQNQVLALADDIIKSVTLSRRVISTNWESKSYVLTEDRLSNQKVRFDLKIPPNGIVTRVTSPFEGLRITSGSTTFFFDLPYEGFSFKVIDKVKLKRHSQFGEMYRLRSETGKATSIYSNVPLQLTQSCMGPYTEPIECGGNWVSIATNVYFHAECEKQKDNYQACDEIIRNIRAGVIAQYDGKRSDLGDGKTYFSIKQCYSLNECKVYLITDSFAKSYPLLNQLTRGDTVSFGAVSTERGIAAGTSFHNVSSITYLKKE